MLVQKGRVAQWTYQISWWGPLPLVQKGQTHTVGYAVGMQYAVGTLYAVCVSAKSSTKRSNLHSGYAVCSMQYVLVQKGQLQKLRHKKSTYTMDLANMGRGDCYL